jgi:hypothetical protein
MKEDKSPRYLLHGAGIFTFLTLWTMFTSYLVCQWYGAMVHDLSLQVYDFEVCVVVILDVARFILKCAFLGAVPCLVVGGWVYAIESREW